MSSRRNIRMFAMMGCWMTVVTGCVRAQAPQPTAAALSSDLATGTAIVASKFTQAAALTHQPMTAAPTEPLPFANMPWTPSPDDGISASDSGKSFEIWITSRISVILDPRVHPVTDLREECVPAGVLGRVSNIPAVPAPFYVIRYEGVQLGKCTIRDGQFEVTIAVVAHP